MIWNGVSNEERLRLWKKLRDDIKDQSIDHKLDAIADFYASMPYGARSIDYYSPEDWPTPWEILYYGSFCTSSISLLIFYTIILAAPEQNVDLYLVEDDSGLYLLPVVDSNLVLNYHLGEVNTLLELSDEFEIRQIFPQGQVKTIT